MAINLIFDGNKAIMETNGIICKSTEELINSEPFKQVLTKFIDDLKEKRSGLLGIFGADGCDEYEEKINSLTDTLRLLSQFKSEEVVKWLPESCLFLKDPHLLNRFIERLYDYWRGFERFLSCNVNDGEEERPYRTFRFTEEGLTDLIRAAYRDLQENIIGRHPRVYRQTHAGANFGIIVSNKDWPYPTERYAELFGGIPMIRQILIKPPVIIDPSMNKRTGDFIKVDKEILNGWTLEKDKWLYFPARIGPLLGHIYFHRMFIELGCSLANLFEIADVEDIKRKPDLIVVHGAPESIFAGLRSSTAFCDDIENDLLVGLMPAKKELGYFGYSKKMPLTLQNVVTMKQGRMPFHGALVHIIFKNGKKTTVLIIGDTGAGKSEMLEAFRALFEDIISDIIIISDDMGSLWINQRGEIIGYGTEIGGFVRLDDFSQGYAFRQLDRAIFMSPHKINSRVVLPVTTLEEVLRGYPTNYLLYANNYEQIDTEHPIIEQFDTASEALNIFRAGTSMAKGTTTAQGITHSYFANPFGPQEYRELHEEITTKYFNTAFTNGVFVGQIRTRLGIPGWEMEGPREAAKALFELISNQ
jgi:hypothetical protein